MFQALKKLLQKINKSDPGLLTIDRSQYACSTSVSIDQKTAITHLETIAKNRSLQDRFLEHQFGKGTDDNDLQILSWGEGTTLRIGAFCSIAAGVQILIGGEHRVDWISTYPFNVLWEAGKKSKGIHRQKEMSI